MLKKDLQKLESIMKSRFFISQTANIYGGVSGFYDMGPILTGMKQNLITEWRKHFVYFDNLHEIDTSCLLPYSVLKASGHVDKFCDILIKDEKTDVPYRADHFLADHFSTKNITAEIDKILKNVDCMSCSEIDQIIQKYDIKSPDNNNFKPAFKFNLMFETFMGLKNSSLLFLRPETAQGQFLNFKKLYEFNNKKMPFGSCSVGKAFRNEISPRTGLIRTREFEQAEIEFFVAPNKKKFKKFYLVKNLEIVLFLNENNIVMKLENAIEKKIINNEILAYFMGRAYLFLLNIGIDRNKIRFRQHKKDEMAHYAKDCWDIELHSSQGWIECVGIADRSAFDLTCHGKAANIDLSYSEKLDDPIVIKEWRPIIEKKNFIKHLKNNFDAFEKEIKSLKNSELLEMMITEESENFINYKYKNEIYKVPCEFVEFKIFEKKIVPDVIEPSFGIGRILYILLEHLFYIRSSDRPVLKLTPQISYIKCVISYVIYRIEFDKHIDFILNNLRELNILTEYNNRSCSIGKKYASCDEIGIPFFITFDNNSLEDNKVTIRERDSMEQIRVEIEKVCFYIEGLVSGKLFWEKIKTP